MDYSFQGFHRDVTTFSGTVKAGELVVLSGNCAVKTAEDDGAFIGVCVASQGDSAAVQLYGAVEAAFTGTTAPALGYQGLSASGSNTVKADEDGPVRLVLSVDSDAKKVVFLL